MEATTPEEQQKVDAIIKEIEAASKHPNSLASLLEEIWDDCSWYWGRILDTLDYEFNKIRRRYNG